MKVRVKVSELGNDTTYYPQYRNSIKNDFTFGIFSDLDWHLILFVPIIWLLFIVYVIVLPIRLLCWENFEESYNCSVKFKTLSEAKIFLDSKINTKKPKKVKRIVTYINYPQ